jgi:hypothetical protein
VYGRCYATFSQCRCHGIQGREHSTKYANTLQHVLCSTAHRNGLSTSLRLCSKAPVAWLRLWTHAKRTTHCAQSALCSVAPSVLRNPSKISNTNVSYTKKSTTRSKTSRPSRNKAAPLVQINKWKGDSRTYLVCSVAPFSCYVVL